MFGNGKKKVKFKIFGCICYLIHAKLGKSKFKFPSK